MVRITIELWPRGNAAAAQHLGTITIANDGSGTATVGNYRVSLSKRGQPVSTWRMGQVIGFPRRRLGVYDLLYRALRACGIAERNPVAGLPAGEDGTEI